MWSPGRFGVLGVMALLLALAVGLPFTAPFRTETGAYRFIALADNSGPLRRNFIAPSVNKAGTVVFCADQKDGGTGIFATSRSHRTPLTLVDTKGDLNGFGHLALINEEGVVSFSGHYNAGPSAVFVVSDKGGPHTLIGTSGGKVTDYMNRSCPINRAGQILYGDLQGPSDYNLLVGNAHGGPPVLAFDATGLGFTHHPNGDIDDDGHLVFIEGMSAGGEGLYTAERVGDPPVLLLASRPGRFLMMGSPVVNNRGDVLFRGARNDPHGPLYSSLNGIYKISRTGGTPTAVVESHRGSFSDFIDYAINDAGKIVFWASVNEKHGGVYAGPDPVHDKVIGPGDPLFGSTLDWSQFGRRGLNQRGEIAFSYILADERTGVALAVPVRWGAWIRGVLYASSAFLAIGLAFVEWRRRTALVTLSHT